jgi:hypothetical protein
MLPPTTNTNVNADKNPSLINEKKSLEENLLTESFYFDDVDLYVLSFGLFFN